MLLGAKLQHSMQSLGNKNNYPVQIGNKYNSFMKRTNFLNLNNIQPVTRSNIEKLRINK